MYNEHTTSYLIQKLYKLFHFDEYMYVELKYRAYIMCVLCIMYSTMVDIQKDHDVHVNM